MELLRELCCLAKEVTNAGNVKGDRSMMKKISYLLTSMLIFSSCSGTHEKNGSQTQSSSFGTLTLDGTTDKLLHVFARRIELYRLGGDEAIAVFLANKPLPEAELNTLLDEYAYGANERDFLKDNSINGLFFIIKKEELFKDKYVGFERFVIKAGRLFEAPVMVGEWFKEFSLMQGRIIARSNGPEYVPEDYQPENGLQYSYTTRFEADLHGRSVVKEFEGSPSADVGAVFSKQGTAQGELILNGKNRKLRYAYARRKRVFFDEPDELVHVLITEQPVSVEEVATILDLPPSERNPQRLVLRFFNNPEAWAQLEIDGYYPDSLEFKDFLIKQDRISGKSRGLGQFGNGKWSYSLSLDIPF